MKGRYEHLFGRSWQLLFRNLLLFVPNVLSLILTFIITAGFFWLSGLAGLVLENPYFLRDGLLSLFTDFARLTDFLFYFSLYLVLEMINLVYFTGVKYGMAKDVVEKHRCSFFAGWSYGKTSFVKLFQISIVGLILLIVPIAVLYYFSTLFLAAPFVLTVLILVLFLAVLAIYFFAVSLHLMFFIPTMYFHDKDFLHLVKHDLTYVKTNFLHTLLVWLIVMSVFLFFFFLRTPFVLVQDYYTSVWILFIASIIMLVLEQVFQVWKNLFVFLAYQQQ